MSITYIDGGHYFKGYFEGILQRIAEYNPEGTIILFSVFGNNHLNRTGFKIFTCGEPSNLVSYRGQTHILIDCKNTPSLRDRNTPFLYLPFYVTSFGERFKNKPEDLFKAKIPDQIIPKKSKFCAFLYSQQVSFRNKLYDVINRYKPVDALGKARSNRHTTDRHVIEPGVITYNDLAVQKYKPYKFVICCENSRHPGYVTEKIVSAMLANAIPIYLGAPDIADHFNPNAFINVANYPTYEIALEEIRRIDQNDELYMNMLAQPWFRDGVPNKYFDPDYCIPFLKENYIKYKNGTLASLQKTTPNKLSRKPKTVKRNQRRRLR